MDIYDNSANNFVKWSQVSPKWNQYLYYLNGQQIHPQNQIQILQILTNPKNKSPLIITNINHKRQDKQINQIIANQQFRQHFNPSQLDLINKHPQMLFHQRLWAFKYTMNREAEIDKQRQKQLRQQFVKGGDDWKQVSLQQLQSISKSYQKIIQQTIKN